jgi:hypothetical protein
MNVHTFACKVRLHIIFVTFQTQFFSADLKKKNSVNIKFNENQSSESRVFLLGQRKTNGRTDRRKIIVAFGDFENAHKNHLVSVTYSNISSF